MRAILAREAPLEYQGEEWTLPLPEGAGTGLGKPLRLLARPVQERIPIYLGAIGPRAVRQVGELADGWLPFMFTPRAPDVLLDPLREGVEAAGRSPADVDIAPVVPVAPPAPPAPAPLPSPGGGGGGGGGGHHCHHDPQCKPHGTPSPTPSPAPSTGPPAADVAERR